jgi:transposase
MPDSYSILKRSRISPQKFRQILRYFSLDLTACQMTALTGLNRNTINRYLTLIRRAIALHCESESPFAGESELDESYFGAKRIRGKRGRGAYGKTIVFGIYKRNGCVYTEIVPNCSRKTLYAIVEGKVSQDSTIHTDGFRSYDSIVDLGYQKHYRINHGNDEFALGTNHINGIEGFWGLAKVRLVKFRGMRKSTFYLHLKECEFRFNYRKQNLYSTLLKIIK